MSRYIDAEWLLNFFEPYPDDYHTPLGTLRACVDDAPHIDLDECIPRYYYNKVVEELCRKHRIELADARKDCEKCCLVKGSSECKHNDNVGFCKNRAEQTERRE